MSDYADLLVDLECYELDGDRRVLRAAIAAITALRAEVERIRTQLDDAIHRIEDMLEDDDGQAFKGAGKFLLRIKGHNHE